MHLDHSVHNRPMEKIEKNDTGGVSEEKRIYLTGLRCSEGIRNHTGERKERGVTPSPPELFQRGEGALLFLFPLFSLPCMKESFVEAGFHFSNFLITQTQPPVSFQDPLPLSLK